MVFSDAITGSLAEFHEDRKNDEVFAEPARTFATTMTFRSSDYLSVPPEPDDERLRSYFERNKESFDLPPPAPPPPPPPSSPEGNVSSGEQGPVGETEPPKDQIIDSLALLAEANESAEVAELTFEDVREEVRQRIIEGDRIDAERDAEDLAKEAASKFLLQLHQLSDDLKKKYASSYDQLRQSPELSDLISESNSATGKIDFSEKEMEIRGGILV